MSIVDLLNRSAVRRSSFEPAGGALIRADRITVAYGAEPVIKNVDLTIEAGDMIGIVGPSGSGKSTLLKALLGGIEPCSGTVTRRRDTTIGFVPQVVAATVLATMNVMGVTLIAATLVVPAVVARMLTDSFAKMLAIATVMGGISGLVGMNLSYHHDLPSGSTIVLVGAVFFILAFLGGERLRSRAGTVAHAH